jgi:CTP:molybdopterin cytidylyltransferase MocA
VTVAAVILAASPDSALADADGLPSVRRIADAAWSGGAVPVVVVSLDPDGRVAAALSGAPVTLAEPAPRETGPVGQIVRGVEVAATEVQGTDGAIVWPARMTWVGPETITSLIEAHGTNPDSIVQPAFEAEPGWPILFPVDRLDDMRAIAADRMPDEVFADLDRTGIPRLTLDLGDPGTAHDRDTPRSSLPPYVGPGEPAGGHVHEWGAVVADTPDDAPLEGPALAPYGQAAEGDTA